MVARASLENEDALAHFYHPARHRASFKESSNDRVWNKTENVLRKLSFLELTTVTGRSHSILP